MTTVADMTSDPRTVTVQDPEGRAPRMSLTLPGTWGEVPDAGPVLAAYSDGRALSPSIATNVVLTAMTVPEGQDLEDWQGAVRAAQMSTLPDLQVLDDRRLDAADGSTQWYTASVMTDQSGVSVLTRRWSRVVGERGLTLTLTTVPMVDAQHAELLDAVAASWTVDAPATDGALVDHA